jgi:NADPH-ferrihemoprotein reductase
VNEVSLFLLANTGEGEPPENTVRFLKVLRGKEQLEGEVDWNRIHFSVFGLGNTQYEHFNKTGIDIDALLAKNGGKRLHKLGLGDDNCSLEDDFTEWRKDLWKTLKEFRKTNPLKEVVEGEKEHK